MRSVFGCPAAVARVGGEDSGGPAGVVSFYPRRDGVLVEADIRGLPQTETGIFGFHIHGGPSCGGADFADAGGHFDPEGREHPCHAGDLPPLFGCGGRAYMAVFTGRFRVPDILGRTVIIHDCPDDFTTQPSGNSGARIACGVIRPVR